MVHILVRASPHLGDKVEDEDAASGGREADWHAGLGVRTALTPEEVVIIRQIEACLLGAAPPKLDALRGRRGRAGPGTEEIAQGDPHHSRGGVVEVLAVCGVDVRWHADGEDGRSSHRELSWPAARPQRHLAQHFTVSRHANQLGRGACSHADGPIREQSAAAHPLHCALSDRVRRLAEGGIAARV